MSTEFKEFCSNSECNYTNTYTRIPGPNKFCTKCGSKIISKCSSCNNDFPKITENFCPECGTKIKESK